MLRVGVGVGVRVSVSVGDGDGHVGGGRAAFEQCLWDDHLVRVRAKVGVSHPS